ncbi:MAG: ATP-binding protein, partial [Elusimicrobiota bacterium]
NNPAIPLVGKGAIEHFRLAFKVLKDWKDRAGRLPLLIRGARQVGKTWLVREHAKLYDNFVEINLESHREYLGVFKEYYGKPKELIAAISLVAGQKIEDGKTLLFIDEIQESKEALLSLRYFKENMPEQHVIAAGSLLEFAFKDFSFPVGRIQFFHLFPINFEEYLIATNRQDLVNALLALNEKNPVPVAVHEKLLSEIALYCLIGGMPEVVKTYIETDDWRICQELQQVLVANFREDFYKYASKANIEHVRLVFNSAPRLLGQKFKYSNVDSGVKSRELSEALGLLGQAGLIYKAFHTSANGLPLAAQLNPKKFKVFFLDIGLAQRILGLNLAQSYLERKVLLANRGAIAEQFVAQEMASFTGPNQPPELFYWHRETRSSQAEIDLVAEFQSSVFPIEVKSHRSGNLRSLHLFLEEKGRFVAKALKVSSAPYSLDGKIMTLPFYALLKLRER